MTEWSLYSTLDLFIKNKLVRGDWDKVCSRDDRGEASVSLFSLGGEADLLDKLVRGYASRHSLRLDAKHLFVSYFSRGWRLRL